MADKEKLHCSNAECGEVIRKNKKGVHPKFCPECDEPVVVVEVVKCPHCGEELSKNKKGQYPKSCPECDKPTDTSKISKSSTLQCFHCGEDIVKTTTGKYPNFCLECEKPIVLTIQHVEVLKCPECGEERSRSPKTKKLSNICVNCGYIYSKGKFIQVNAIMHLSTGLSLNCVCGKTNTKHFSS